MTTVAEDSGLVIDGWTASRASVRPGSFDRTRRTRNGSRRSSAGSPDRLRRTAPRASSVRWPLPRASASSTKPAAPSKARIAREARGTAGFGYDPIFYYPPYRSTLAEVTEDAKLAVAHRGQAFRSLASWLRPQLPTSTLNLHVSFCDVQLGPKGPRAAGFQSAQETLTSARLDDHQSVVTAARTGAMLCAPPRIDLGVCHQLCRWRPGCLSSWHVGFGIEVGSRLGARRDHDSAGRERQSGATPSSGSNEDEHGTTTTRTSDMTAHVTSISRLRRKVIWD